MRLPPVKSDRMGSVDIFKKINKEALKIAVLIHF